MAGQALGSLDTSSLGEIHSVQLDYYGKRAAVASSDNAIYICDVIQNQQKPSAQLKGHEGPVWKVVWAHPKFGPIVVSGGFDMKAIVWKETSPSQWQIVYLDASHAASVNDVKFCPWEHGLRFASASSDGTVIVHSHSPMDHQWQRAVFQAHGVGVLALSMAPAQYRDGSPVTTMRFSSCGCDNAVKCWKADGDMTTWAQEMPPMPVAHTDWVRDVAWRPDDCRILASGGWDKSVIIWRQESEGRPWSEVRRLQMDSKVEGLSWSETGGILAISFGDRETTLFKETDDGSYVEVGKVSESGFTEDPNNVIAQAVAAAAEAAASAAPPAVQAHPGVQIETIRPGDGVNFPKKGDFLSMHYTGTIAASGVKFDSSLDRGTPFDFQIGLGKVIDGWDVGVIQLSLGQKAVLRIVPDLAYGPDGAGGVIPPNADLIFEVELLKIN